MGRCNRAPQRSEWCLARELPLEEATKSAPGWLWGENVERVSSIPPISSTRPGVAGRQRRASRRIAYNGTVEVLQPVAGAGVTINISEGGLRLAVDCALCEGEGCLLRITPPVGEPHDVRAVVAWSRKVRDGWIVGLRRLALN